MPKIVPCLWFDQNAEEAAEFYVSVFPNSKVRNVLRYPENSPFPGQFPPGTAMTVDFELDGQPITGLNGGPMFTFSEATSLQIFCNDQEEIDHYWESLTADGGEESQCGWLKDKFGFSWQVVPKMLGEIQSDDDAKQQAVAEAIFSMRKLVIADLQAAYDGAG
jgi:predicted 3-demethylubiquinone-9 3-methyltransferase (glyoxalase superfamily)